jgi:steroid delta-isomerase-like uncharacterized protein
VSTSEATTPRGVVERLHRELLGGRDLTTVDELFAPDFVSHTMPPELPPGREGVKQFFARFADALPDIDVRIDETVVEGDRAAVVTTTTGTHERELFGIPPTGRRVAVTGIDWVRVADGRIVEHRGLTDIVGLLRQLGGVPESAA